MIQAHVRMLADPYAGRPPGWIRQHFAPLVVKLMDSASGWVWNRPPHTKQPNQHHQTQHQSPQLDNHSVVPGHMDLATIKRRLDRSEYRAVSALLRDVRLIFAHAIQNHGPQSQLGSAARAQLDDFDHAATTTRHMLEQEQAQRRAEEDRCALCGEGDLYFESPVFCSGPLCRGKRIRRHSNYYACQRTKDLLCTACHTEVQKQPPQLGEREFLRLRHSDREDEPWVQCDSCQRWVHQICALANPERLEDPNFEYAFVCASCLGANGHDAHQYSQPRSEWRPLREAGHRDETGASPPVVGTSEGSAGHQGAIRDATTISPRTVAGQATASAQACQSPAPTKTQHAPIPTGPHLVEAVRRVFANTRNSREAFSARALAEFPLSKFLEAKLTADLQVTAASVSVGSTSGGIPDKCSETGPTGHLPKLHVRLLSNTRRVSTFPTEVRARYLNQRLPEEIPFWSKCIALFQECDGIDLLLFIMYVFEYDDPASGPNYGRVYISYLDSVKYFKPACLRQRAYQGLVANYLAHAKLRGFHTAHIWACPPEKGDDYIFYCHPLDQRIPKEDQLRQWYHTVLEQCKREGTVGRVTGFLEQVVRSDARVADVPFFEGDYWATELANAVSAVQVQARAALAARQEQEAAKDRPPRKRARRSSGRARLRGRASIDVATSPPAMAALPPTLASPLPASMPPDDGGRDPVLDVLAGGIAAAEKDFFVIELHPQSERTTVVAPDANPPQSSDMFDHRRLFLGFCQKRNFQFDSLRRAKFSSCMAIFELHRAAAAQGSSMGESDAGGAKPRTGAAIVAVGELATAAAGPTSAQQLAPFSTSASSTRSFGAQKRKHGGDSAP